MNTAGVPTQGADYALQVAAIISTLAELQKRHASVRQLYDYLSNRNDATETDFVLVATQYHNALPWENLDQAIAQLADLADSLREDYPQ
jgi:hypothetical protein